jgi:ParB family chromosome partitioning protein
MRWKDDFLNRERTNNTENDMKKSMIRDVAPGLLKAHPLNREFSREGDVWEDFLESVRRPGRVFARLLVREVPGGLEILAGHRRAAAAEAAGLETVPVEVLEGMADEDALTLVINENLQRAEMTPLDEARMVRAMQETFGMSDAEICERIVRPVAWVRLRQGLLDLGDEVCQAVVADRDDPRHVSLGAVAEVLAVPADLREQAIQMVLHPEMETRALNAHQARDVLRSCLVKPWQEKMEWEKIRDKEVEKVREWIRKEARLKKRDMPAVVSAEYEEGPGLMARGYVAADALVPDVERAEGAPVGLRWLDVALRHGLAVRVFRDGFAMVHGELLRNAEKVWLEYGKEPWLVAAGSVQRAVPGAGGDEPVIPGVDAREDEEEREEGTWTQGEMTGRMWIDSRALRMLAMWSVSESEEIDVYPEMPKWAFALCYEVGIARARDIVGDMTLWVKGLQKGGDQ